MTSSTTDWNTLCTTITTNYSNTLKEELSRPSPIMKLLESKVKAAQRQMAEELEQQLFYGSSYSKPYTGKPLFKQEYPKAEDMGTDRAFLRKCIADAYDEVMANQRERQNEMADDAVSKALAKRKEDRAIVILDKLDELFEGYDWDTAVEWTEVYPTNPDKVYRSAAKFSDGLWYRTNVNGGRTLEQLKAEITEKAIDGEVFIEGTEL